MSGAKSVPEGRTVRICAPVDDWIKVTVPCEPVTPSLTVKALPAVVVPVAGALWVVLGGLVFVWGVCVYSPPPSPRRASGICGGRTTRWRGGGARPFGGWVTVP